jgi:hypothetical protein
MTALRRTVISLAASAKTVGIGFRSGRALRNFDVDNR